MTIAQEDLALAVVRCLTYREREVVMLRYGIDDGHTYTLAEVGSILKVTRERVRQIESRAVRKIEKLVERTAFENAEGILLNSLRIIEGVRSKKQKVRKSDKEKVHSPRP